MTKQLIFATLLSCFSIITFGQEKDDLHFLEADSTWAKEIIEFPLGFAPEIPFEGYEDLRFAEGWSNKDSPGFWSYVCAWRVNGRIEPTASMLEYYMQLYFDGLMNIGPNRIGDENIHSTAAVFHKETETTYGGKIKTFDTRYTKNLMTLNVEIEVQFCPNSNATIVLFRLSPKEFEDGMWVKLKKVKVKDGFCD